MPKYPEAMVGSFSSWLGELPTNRIGVHFVGRTRSRRPASWRCSLPDTNLFRSFSSRRIFRDGRQRRATTLRRSLTISGMSFPIVPTSKDSNDCGLTSLRQSRKCRRMRPGGLPKRSVHQPCSTNPATTMPARAPNHIARQWTISATSNRDRATDGGFRSHESGVDRHSHGRLVNRERDLDSSRIRRFLENQTLLLKTRKDTRPQSHLPTWRRSGCRHVTWFFGEAGQLVSSSSTANHVALNGVAGIPLRCSDQAFRCR